MCTKSKESFNNIQISAIPELKDYLLPFEGPEEIEYLFSPDTPMDLLKSQIDNNLYKLVEYTSWENSEPERLFFAVLKK